MNWKQLVLAILLLDFVALTGYVLMQHGYLGFFEIALSNSATLLMGVDLLIGLGLIALWMWRDAQARGAAVVPYLLVTAAFGAAGPLLYLIVREHQGAREGAHAPA